MENRKKCIFLHLATYLFDSLRAQLRIDFPFFSTFFFNGLPLKMWPILTEFSHCTRGPFLYSIPSSSNANGIHLDFFFSTSNSSSRLTEEKLLFVGDRSKGFSLCQKRFFSMRIAELDMLSVSSERKFHHPSIYRKNVRKALKFIIFPSNCFIIFRFWKRLPIYVKRGFFPNMCNIFL